MATKNFRSTVLEPTSEFARGDKLRFTALATVSEVLKGSFSETTIGEDGVYSVDLQYGKHRIDYKPYEGVWRHFADVEVNADTLATTLQDLALSSVPVTDEAVLILQGILADAEAAKTAAETAEAAAESALASIDGIIADVESGYPELFASMFSLSVTIYLNKDAGNDANDGKTIATAVKTLKRAIELAKYYNSVIQITTTGVYSVSERLMSSAANLSIIGENQNHYPSGSWSDSTTTVINIDKTSAINSGFAMSMRNASIFFNMLAFQFTARSDDASFFNSIVTSPSHGGGNVDFRVTVFDFDSSNRGIITSGATPYGINATVGFDAPFFQGSPPKAVVIGDHGTVVVSMQNTSNTTGSSLTIASSGIKVLS